MMKDIYTLYNFSLYYYRKLIFVYEQLLLNIYTYPNACLALLLLFCPLK